MMGGDIQKEHSFLSKMISNALMQEVRLSRKIILKVEGAVYLIFGVGLFRYPDPEFGFRSWRQSIIKSNDK